MSSRNYQHVDPPNHSWVVGLIIEQRDEHGHYVPDTVTDAYFYLDCEPDDLTDLISQNPGYIIVSVVSNRSMN